MDHTSDGQAQRDGTNSASDCFVNGEKTLPLPSRSPIQESITSSGEAPGSSGEKTERSRMSPALPSKEQMLGSPSTSSASSSDEPCTSMQASATRTAAGEPSGPRVSSPRPSSPIVTHNKLLGTTVGSLCNAKMSPVCAIDGSSGVTQSPSKIISSTPTRDRPFRGDASSPSDAANPAATPSPRGGRSQRFELRFVSSSPIDGERQKNGGSEAGALWREGLTSTTFVAESPVTFDLASTSPRAITPSTPSSLNRGPGQSSMLGSSSFDSDSSNPKLRPAPHLSAGAGGMKPTEDLNLPSLGLNVPDHVSAAQHIRSIPQSLPPQSFSNRPPRPAPFRPVSQRSASSFPRAARKSLPASGKDNVDNIDHPSGFRQVSPPPQVSRNSLSSVRKLRDIPSLLRRVQSAGEGDSLLDKSELSPPLRERRSFTTVLRRTRSAGEGDEAARSPARQRVVSMLRRPRSLDETESAAAESRQGWMALGRREKAGGDINGPVSQSDQSLSPQSTLSAPSNDRGGRGSGCSGPPTKLKPSLVSGRIAHRNRGLCDVDSRWPDEPQVPNLISPPTISRTGSAGSPPFYGQSNTAEEEESSPRVSMSRLAEESSAEEGVPNSSIRPLFPTGLAAESDGEAPRSPEGSPVAKGSSAFSPLSMYHNAVKEKKGISEAAANIVAVSTLTRDGLDAKRGRVRRRPGVLNDVLKSPEFEMVMGRGEECMKILHAGDSLFINGDFVGAQRSYARAVNLALARLQGRRLVQPDDSISSPEPKGAGAAVDKSEALLVVRGISSILLRLGNAYFRHGDLIQARHEYKKARKFLAEVVPRIETMHGSSATVVEGMMIPRDLEIVVSRSDDSGGSNGTKSTEKEGVFRHLDLTQDLHEHEQTASDGLYELPYSLRSVPTVKKPLNPDISGSATPQSSYEFRTSMDTGKDAPIEGRSLNNLASVDARRRRYKSATTLYAQSIRIKRRALRSLLQAEGEGGESETEEEGVGDSHRTSVLEIASTLHNIGQMRHELGKLSKAEDAYKQALSLRVEKCGLDDLRVARTLSGLGDLYLARGQYDHALRSYGEVLRIRRSALGPRHVLVGATLHNMGLVHLKKGPYSAARVALADALRARRDALGGSHWDVACTGYLLGLVLTLTGDLISAKALLEDALRIRCKHLGEKSGHLTILNTRLAIGEIQRREGLVKKALEIFQCVYDGRAARLGKGHPSVAEAMRFIGLAKRDEGDYNAAVEAFDGALRIQLKRLGDDSVEAAETQIYLSDAYFKVGRSKEAMEACQQSMLTIVAKIGSDHILYSKGLKVHGDLLQGQGRHDDALKAYHDVLTIRATWEETNHIDIGDTWNNIGNALFKKGDFEESKNAFTEALKIKRHWLDDEHVSVFTTLNNLGHSYYKLRDLGLALKTYTESLKNQMARLSGEKKAEFLSQLKGIADRVENMDFLDSEVRQTSTALGNVAATLRNIGLVYQDQSKFHKALEVYERILTVRKTQPISDHAAIAATAETIGMLHFKLGNYEGALGAFSESLNVKKMSQGGDTIDVARTLNNLANVYFSSGNPDQAMAMYEKSLDIKRVRLGIVHEEVANTLNNIAHVLFTSGQDDRSLEAYNEVLIIRKQKFGARHSAVGTTLATMGDVYLRKGAIFEARTCFEESIAIRKQQSDRTVVEDARVFESLGVVRGKLGDWKGAEVAFSESLKLKTSAFGNDHEEISKTLDSLALARIEQGLFEDAIQPLEDALRIRKARYSNVEGITTVMTKIAYLHKKSGRPDIALQMYADIERLESTGGSDIVSEQYASF